MPELSSTTGTPFTVNAFEATPTLSIAFTVMMTESPALITAGTTATSTSGLIKSVTKAISTVTVKSWVSNSPPVSSTRTVTGLSPAWASVGVHSIRPVAGSMVMLAGEVSSK